VSGPVSTDDAPADPTPPAGPPAAIEVTESRAASVGGFPVQRALPRRQRRTVGAWCFVDHMGPGEVEGDVGIGVGPHPHIGLQTVTWLLAGEILHRDSLGTEQVIRPGQLNLMTAGRGVSHSEEGTGSYRGVLHGVQLWVAQPSSTRGDAPAFEHHAELPQVELDGGEATYLVGGASPARRDTDHVGIDLALRADSTLPMDPTHEHALVVFEGEVRLDDEVVTPGHLAYVGAGADELRIQTTGCRALLVGGVPFPEPVLMWWNYVGRTRDEIIEAHRAWSEREERFGTVASPLDGIDVAPPPWP
jgi:redox-sensitive bicupin YhaK (pirin superfamily)